MKNFDPRLIPIVFIFLAFLAFMSIWTLIALAVWDANLYVKSGTFIVAYLGVSFAFEKGFFKGLFAYLLSNIVILTIVEISVQLAQV